MDHHPRAHVATDTAMADDVEAWGIAVDLIADLGAKDAMAWASEYMSDLEDDDRPGAVARWSLVTNALVQLIRARLH